MNFIKNNGGRENYFPVNLKKDKTNDCVIRSISIATDMDYIEVRDDLFDLAKEQGRMPNDKKVYESYLASIGWIKCSPIYNENGRKYRLKDIPKSSIPSRVIFHTRNHVCAVVDKNLNDKWDCRNWCANSYYIKQGSK